MENTSVAFSLFISLLIFGLFLCQNGNVAAGQALYFCLFVLLLCDLY